MKRHVSLRPLSRDHHVSLHHAVKLIKSADGPASAREATISAFLAAWRGDIDEHFALEERYLLPFLKGMPEAERLVREHAILRGLAKGLSDGRPEVSPARAGEMLRDHVRWEERALFPLLERTLTDNQLEALLKPFAAHEAAHRKTPAAD